MKKFLIPIAAICLLASCGVPKKIKYFQDSTDGTIDQIATPVDITIHPGDKLFIVVHSRDIQLMNLFNLPYISQRIGQTSDNIGGTMNNGALSGYTVDKNGDIDFPVIGKTHLEGLTREQVAETIKFELVDRNLVRDAVVTVDYMNLYISVMGEVAKPGRYPITKDNYTILDAISAAGDLTIQGLRDGVKVLRNVGDRKQTFTVDLKDSRATMSSPVYYLQQDDIIYVEPNNMKSRQSTVNGNNILSASFWISFSSLATSVAVLVLNSVKK